MSDSGLNPLDILSDLPHPVADLVRDYLAEKHDWKVDDWFLKRTNAIFNDKVPTSDDSPLLDEVSFEPDIHVASSVRFVSIHPHYFRGFREVENAIDISGDLVVIDGRNSSGKTSLAEAIEWILTGQLVRRDFGDSKELAECIANRFRPDKEATWVECILDYNGETVTLKRLLLNDYGPKKKSRCETRLFLNASEVSNSSDILHSLFAGVAPLLMQHTLQQFVLQNPAERRSYFERLLNLDYITSLIQNAVVGDTGIAHFGRENGGAMLNVWNELRTLLPDVQSILFLDVERCDPNSVSEDLRKALRSVATRQFALDSQLSFESMVDHLGELQRKARQGQFPLLEQLRPKRSVDKETMSQLSGEQFVTQIQRLKEAHEKFETARETERHLSEAEEAIASAFQVLQGNGLISDAQQQICPLCSFDEPPTLSKRRIEEISTWNSVREILSKVRDDFRAELQTMMQDIKTLSTLRRQLLPQHSEDVNWGGFEKAQINDKLTALKTQYQNSKEDLNRFDELCDALLDDSESTVVPAHLESNLARFVSELQTVVRHAKKYSQAFDEFEDCLDELASADQSYAAREKWINLQESSDELIKDLRWENSKANAQRELQQMREQLIKFRQNYLEARRQGFSNGINEIWAMLREDRYSSFKSIVIPKPSGRGFPVKLEVKAILDDGSRNLEIDALNVLSESQINVIGIAAFITRSQMIGHRCLVFDDPVQSMDDEHFRTFANELLSYLCDLGLQIILLSHNDLFARDVSHFHYDRANYITMKIRHSRREGIVIEEGNRRVSERLNIAERLAEEGNLDRAWYYVRIAIERLYTVVKLKHGPEGFDARSWANHTILEMWNAGINKIFERFAPGSEKRLKDISDMALAGGHDKAESGSTDLFRAVEYIRPLLTTLRIGG